MMTTMNHFCLHRQHRRYPIIRLNLPLFLGSFVILFVLTSFYLSLYHLDDLYSKNSGNIQFPLTIDSQNLIPKTTTTTAKFYGAAASHNSNQTINNKNLSNHRSDGLPYLIIHIGPQKTMSSAMQCVLQDLSKFLQLDNYNFVGKVDARACFKNSIARPIDSAIENMFWHQNTCVDLLLNAAAQHQGDALQNALNEIDCWKSFQDALNEIFFSGNNNQKTSIILSDEKLSEVQLLWWDIPKTIQFWNFLHGQLQHQFHIRIVIVYRRYYEWLASIKNQADKYSLGRRGMKEWPTKGPEKEPIFQQLVRWIHNTTDIPSPYTPTLYDVFKNQIHAEVSLLNMHDTNHDLLEMFLCHSLVGADHTCQEYQRAQKLNQRQSDNNNNNNNNHNVKLYQYTSNPSENPFCDQIAYRAYQLGIIRDLRGYRKGADRIFYNEMICRQLARMHITPYDLPLICPTTQELQPLLDLSLQYEQEFLPDFYLSTQGQTVLETRFWNDVKKQKFCSVNTTAVLQDKDWILFLQRQWHPKRGKKPNDWDYTTYKITKQNFTSS